MGSSSAPEINVPKMDLAKDIRKYVAGVSESLPNILNKEAQYRPQFQGLNLGDISSFLSGAGGNQGLFGLSALASQQSGQTLGDARSAEFGQMTGQAGQFRGMMGAVSPEAAAQVQRASQEANRAYQSAQSLNPQEQRMATQQARESYAARGMLDSNSSVVGEAMNRENFLSQKRNDAARRGVEAFGYAQDFYTQPGLTALGSTPLSYQAGQQQLGIGLGSIGQGTPQLYDIGAALNIGAAQRQNIVAAQAAQAQAAASQSAGRSGMWGAIGQGVGQMLGGPIGSSIGKGIGSMFSDRRLKQNIESDGTTHNGFPVYEFEYKFEPGVRYRGVMAQDVQKTKPSAVITIEGGYLAVDYSKL
jgi:hypothetical protein